MGCIQNQGLPAPNRRLNKAHMSLIIMLELSLNYSIVKDSNADLTVGNWISKKDPQSVIVLI